MLGETLSLRACTSGGVDGSRISGSGSISSKTGSVSRGENGSTGSSAASTRGRFLLTEIVDVEARFATLLNLGAPTPFFVERTFNKKGGLSERNASALGPSCTRGYCQPAIRMLRDK